MNIAIPTTRQFHKGSYLMALVGTLSIIAIIATIGFLRVEDSGGASSHSVLTKPALEVTKSDTSLILYLVGTQAEVDWVVAAEVEAANERSASGTPEPEQKIIVLKASTLEEERAAAEVIEAWEGSGSSFRLVDVRHR